MKQDQAVHACEASPAEGKNFRGHTPTFSRLCVPLASARPGVGNKTGPNASDAAFVKDEFARGQGAGQVRWRRGVEFEVAAQHATTHAFGGKQGVNILRLFEHFFPLPGEVCCIG